MPKREKPAIIATVRNGRISPASSFDAEQIAALPNGCDVEITKKAKRSNPQNRLYWQTLHNVVDATGKWPTAEHLHEALKRACGYIEVRYDLQGREYIATDSTSFEAMSPDEFRAYFDFAMSKLAAATGTDPLGFYEEAA